MTGVYDFSICVYKTVCGNWDFKIYMGFGEGSVFGIYQASSPPRMA